MKFGTCIWLRNMLRCWQIFLVLDRQISFLPDLLKGLCLTRTYGEITMKRKRVSVAALLVTIVVFLAPTHRLALGYTPDIQVGEIVINEVLETPVVWMITENTSRSSTYPVALWISESVPSLTLVAIVSLCKWHYCGCRAIFRSLCCWIGRQPSRLRFDLQLPLRIQQLQRLHAQQLFPVRLYHDHMRRDDY